MVVACYFKIYPCAQAYRTFNNRFIAEDEPTLERVALEYSYTYHTQPRSK